MKKRRGFSLLEALCSLSIFSLLALVLFYSLKNASQVWQRSSARDAAVRQLTRARDFLTRDLANGSQSTGQFDTRIAPAPAPSVGDALTFLTADNGSGQWVPDANGGAVMQSEITYYLYAPATNPLGIVCTAGPADAGYEQQNPFKVLVRRNDTPTAAVAPSIEPTIQSGWATWITGAPPAVQTTGIQTVCNQLLGFRVLRSPQEWQIQISAVAVADATRQISLGSTPLGNSRFTLVEQFTIPAHN